MIPIFFILIPLVARRVAMVGETVGDYAIYGIQKMLEDGVFKEDEIGAIIVTTTSPDHFIPPISNIVQGKFDFDEDNVIKEKPYGFKYKDTRIVYDKSKDSEMRMTVIK